jgi:hypothetical protein
MGYHLPSIHASRVTNSTLGLPSGWNARRQGGKRVTPIPRTSIIARWCK